jgi:ADP-heptose:LPS heptosyltransferase
MILISPYAKAMRNGKAHPKNYPWWQEVIDQIDEPIIQVGTLGETQLVPDCRHGLSLTELEVLVKEAKTWISVDSFLQHFAWDLEKYGVVIFAQSDPVIFGHPENTNLLKDRRYLRDKQFWLWEQCDYNEDAFVRPEVVLAALKTFNVNMK